MAEHVVSRPKLYSDSPRKIREIEVPYKFPEPILAVGGPLKGSFALARGARVRLGYYRRGGEDLETRRRFETAVSRREKKEEFQPRIIARDLHPGYLSSTYAEERTRELPGTRAVAVQHHHAHIVSCLAENGISNRAIIGVAFDGSGLGTDGKIWGGSFSSPITAPFNDSLTLIISRYPAASRRSGNRGGWGRSISGGLTRKNS